PKGRIVADMRVLRETTERMLLDVEAAVHESVLRDLGMYKVGRRVKVVDASAERVLLSLIGPRSQEIVEGVLGAPPGPEENSLVEAGGALVVRTNVGVDVIAGAEAAGIRERLLEAGAHPVSF